MKHMRLIIVAMSVIQAIGIVIFVFISPVEIEDSGTISIAPGLESSGYVVVDMEGGGIISGRFMTGSGREVLFMILDERQYGDYLAGETYGTHYSAISSHGEFSVDYAGMEFCHMVVEHAVEPENEEVVAIDYTLSTNDWPLAFAGMGLFFGAVFAEAGAMIKHSRDRKSTIGPISTTDDVVIFDEQPKK